MHKRQDQKGFNSADDSGFIEVYRIINYIHSIVAGICRLDTV